MLDTFVLSFEKKNHKTVLFFAILLIFPNFLGMLNVTTPFDFKIHFFQLAIFLAAYFYGAKGGLLSGTIGSFYSAWMMHNPYILIGNAILGFFVGLFIQYNVGLFWSILLAYCIQLPWLVLTDYFLIHMPLPVLEKLILSLWISNMIWGVTTKMMIKPIKNALK